MLPARAQEGLPSLVERRLVLGRGERASHLCRIPLVVEHGEAVVEKKIVVGPPAVAVENLGVSRVAVVAGREEPKGAIPSDIEVIPYCRVLRLTWEEVTLLAVGNQ